MSASSQHGFHPDAESLSAFAEQALSVRERESVLAHLAVCARCREVVALAASGAEIQPAAAPRRVAEPLAWWKHWRLVWVPSAVAVALAVTTISFLVERAGRQQPNVRITEQSSPQGSEPGSTPAPGEQAEAAPPVMPAPSLPAPQPAQPAHSAAAIKSPSYAAPRETMSDAVVTKQAQTAREAPQAAQTETRQALPDFVAGSTSASYSQPGDAAIVTEQRQADAEARERLYAARAPVNGREEPNAAQQAEPVPAASQSETETVPNAAPAPRFRSMRATTTPPKADMLPSGLSAVSMATGEHVTLALDKLGALFLSRDRGATWEAVAAQWTGRAVVVHEQAQAGSAPAAAQPGSAGNASDGAGSPLAPAQVFELSNDQGQTWVSTDGRSWSPK